MSAEPLPMLLNEAHLRRVFHVVADAGPDPRRDYFSDSDYEEHLRDFMEARPDGPVAVFSYGSLIWKPSFPAARMARATAVGWHRSFCLNMLRYRGTVEVPGLMMQIDDGGECEGVIQEVPLANEWETLLGLWRRELYGKPPGNRARWIQVASEGTVRRVIAFTANPDSPNYTGALAPDVVADRIAFACGHVGSNAEYLWQTVTALERAGIHDPHLWDLQERVARRIESAST